jgi:hypothetical protein
MTWLKTNNTCPICRASIPVPLDSVARLKELLGPHSRYVEMICRRHGLLRQTDAFYAIQDGMMFYYTPSHRTEFARELIVRTAPLQIHVRHQMGAVSYTGALALPCVSLTLRIVDVCMYKHDKMEKDWLRDIETTLLDAVVAESLDIKDVYVILGDLVNNDAQESMSLVRSRQPNVGLSQGHLYNHRA